MLSEQGEMAGRHLRSNFSRLGKLGPLLRRATPATSTGTGCLACTSHAKAFLLFAFLPLSLPSQALSFSQGCCFPLALLGMLASLHPWLPRGGFLGMGAPAPLAATSAGSPSGVVGGLGLPRMGAFPLISPAQNLCFLLFILMLAFGS